MQIASITFYVNFHLSCAGEALRITDEVSAAVEAVVGDARERREQLSQVLWDTAPYRVMQLISGELEATDDGERLICEFFDNLET